MDVKETDVAAPSMNGTDVPVDHAARVVAGALACSFNLGERMASAILAARPVIVRKLMPEA